MGKKQLSIGKQLLQKIVSMICLKNCACTYFTGKSLEAYTAECQELLSLGNGILGNYFLVAYLHFLSFFN